MNPELGIAADAQSWALYAGMVALWGWSLSSISGILRLGWRAVLMSFFGWVWLGFGVDMVIRFAVISFDSYTFGNLSSRLADAASGEVNFALFLATLYFGCLVGAYRLGRRLFARIVHIEILLPAEHSRKGQLWLSFIATVCIVLSSGFIPVPVSLFTVLGIVGSLWIIPAAFVWWERMYRGPAGYTPFLWIFLVPGLLRAVLSPYRENLLMPVFIILVAMLYAGRKLRPTRVIPVVAVLLVVSTIIVSTYREILWQDLSVSDAVEETTGIFTLEKTYDAKWVETLRRFHGFDSLLLTVRYVPSALPYTDRNVFIDALIRGVVPRVVYEAKEGSTRGIEFGQTVWSMDDPAQVESTAAIAPSMPGDLYEAGGSIFVALGGFFWGLVLGLLEGWKDRRPPSASAALTAMFALHCFASIERDYAHVVSTTIQVLIVIILTAILLGRGFPKEEQTRLPREAV